MPSRINPYTGNEVTMYKAGKEWVVSMVNKMGEEILVRRFRVEENARGLFNALATQKPPRATMSKF